jgi:ribosome-binding factor A
MPTFRKERMEEAIRRVISEKILKDGTLIPGTIFTVNRVDISSDFALAKVYYSVFGNIGEKESSTVMKSHFAEFRYEISKRLNLRRTPRIIFCFDKNTEHAFRINSLINDRILA